MRTTGPTERVNHSRTSDSAYDTIETVRELPAIGIADRNCGQDDPTCRSNANEAGPETSLE
jgi:hypothetical protein